MFNDDIQLWSYSIALPSSAVSGSNHLHVTYYMNNIYNLQIIFKSNYVHV